MQLRAVETEASLTYVYYSVSSTQARVTTRRVNPNSSSAFAEQAAALNFNVVANWLCGLLLSFN